jgi:precorrin-2 dehydrogenase/sirohydrochlorin ferrochelatase
MSSPAVDAQSYPYYSICLDVKDRLCVVAGGGDVARRKAASLVECQAKVRVISPKLDSVLEYMAFQHEVEWIERGFEPKDLEGAFMVIAASEEPAQNQEIAKICKQKGILCNIYDHPEDSDFINPTTIDRGALVIAVSTAGLSPNLAAQIRQELEVMYGEEYGTFLEMVARLRPTIQRIFPEPFQRQKINDRMVSSRALDLLQAGMVEEAQKELQRIVDEARRDPGMQSNASLSVM